MEGELPALAAWPQIAERVGVDLDPVDVHDADAVRWLMGCVFADQPRRVQRLRAALLAAREHPPAIVRGDGPSLVGELAGSGAPDVHPAVWHSLVLAYTFESEQRALTASLDRLGAATDLTWIYLEAPAGTPGLPTPATARRRAAGADCALVAVTYRGGQRTVRQLAAADAHVARMSWLP